MSVMPMSRLAVSRSRAVAPRLDWVLLGSAAMILAIGTLLVWSATASNEVLTRGQSTAYLHRHLVNILIGLVLAIELIFVVTGWQLSPELAGMAQAPASGLVEHSNTAQLGEILYTRYAFLFQGAGVILLIAMMGAIVLTLRHRDIKRQKISRQVAQKPGDTIEIRKIRPGEGV